MFNYAVATATPNSSPSPSPSPSSCPPCVVFRIDDISDFRPSATIAVMNFFIAENKPLTLGIVMNHIGKNQAVMEKILEGKNKGIFELALHGYEHVYYNRLSPQEQLDQLSGANQRMHDLFGKPSEIFIPPYDTFNNYTIDAMTKLGIRIISAGEFMYPSFENSQYHLFSVNDTPKGNNSANDTSNNNNNNNNNQVYHIARNTGVESFGETNEPTRLSLGEILNDTNYYIPKLGYAVIVMHPTSFLTMQNGKYTKTVDENEINFLRTLINSLESKNIHITSFSKLAGIDS
jgi:peptidoglycan/xylan/chitin deacetylase (PgdA/CDA1 family)